MSSRIELTNANGKTLSLSNSDSLLVDKNVIYLDTVAELATTSGASGDVAHVSDIDRGGLFVWSSTGTANGGTVFAGLAGYWVRQYSGAVNVKWFGAKGDWNGSSGTDNTSAIQSAIDASSSAKVRLIISDGLYRITGKLNTRSDLDFDMSAGAWLVPTAWSGVGAIFTNVVIPTTSTDSIQSKVKIRSINIDGQYLPYDGLSNDNAIGFARGLSNFTVDNINVKNFMFSWTAGGAGGKAVNVESGVTTGFIGRINASNCGIAFFAQGVDGLNTNGSSKATNRIIVDSVIAENCECAVAGFGINTSANPDGDPADSLVIVNNVVFHNCGHAPNRPVADYQKSGVIVFGEGQNITIRNVKGYNDSTYPTSYPTDSTKIGYGLTGPIGAVVWGWGRNCIVENIEYHGDCDQLIQINRARALGDDASTTGIITNVFNFSVKNLRHFGIATNVINIQSGALAPTVGNIEAFIEDIYTDTITAIVNANASTYTGIFIRVNNGKVAGVRATIEGLASAVYSGRNTFSSASTGTVTGNSINFVEYGTFVPVLRDAAAGNAATAGVSTGRYTKIGNRVFFEINLVNINTTGLTAGNQIFITGLPYIVNSYYGASFNPCPVLPSLVASTSGIIASPVAGQAYLKLYDQTTVGSSNLLVSAITSGTGDLFISGHYEVAF